MTTLAIVTIAGKLSKKQQDILHDCFLDALLKASSDKQQPWKAYAKIEVYKG